MNNAPELNIQKREKKLHKAAEHDFLSLKTSHFLFLQFINIFLKTASFLEIRLIDKSNIHTFMQHHFSLSHKSQVLVVHKVLITDLPCS